LDNISSEGKKKEMRNKKYMALTAFGAIGTLSSYAFGHNTIISHDWLMFTMGILMFWTYKVYRYKRQKVYANIETLV